MRYTMPPRLKEGDTRIKTRFLLFDKVIGNEGRWLEVATWEEKFVHFSPCSAGGARWEWIPQRWIDDE